MRDLPRSTLSSVSEPTHDDEQTAALTSPSPFFPDYEPAPGVNIFCRVFFLDEFESLRRRCGLDGDGGFIESLARCVKWESSGGKSGSAFLKTKGEQTSLL